MCPEADAYATEEPGDLAVNVDLDSQGTSDYLEHDSPAGGSDRFLRRKRSPDLVVFCLDPFVVGAVVMQFSQDFHSFVVTIFLDPVSWTLRQPNQSYEQENGWYDLEAQRKAPLERTRVGGVPGSVSHPGGYDESNADT